MSAEGIPYEELYLEELPSLKDVLTQKKTKRKKKDLPDQDSYLERQNLFKKIWKRTTHQSSKQKPIKTLRIEESTLNLARRERSKELHSACDKILHKYFGSSKIKNSRAIKSRLFVKNVPPVTSYPIHSVIRFRNLKTQRDKLKSVKLKNKRSRARTEKSYSPSPKRSKIKRQFSPSTTGFKYELMQIPSQSNSNTRQFLRIKKRKLSLSPPARFKIKRKVSPTPMYSKVKRELSPLHSKIVRQFSPTSTRSRHKIERNFSLSPYRPKIKRKLSTTLTNSKIKQQHSLTRSKSKRQFSSSRSKLKRSLTVPAYTLLVDWQWNSEYKDCLEDEPLLPSRSNLNSTKMYYESGLKQDKGTNYEDFDLIAIECPEFREANICLRKVLRKRKIFRKRRTKST